MSHFFKIKFRGFTLVELMVSLGIMAVILSVVMLNQRNYTEAASLSNAADTLGLAVSEAQAYGVAVRERVLGSADFHAAFGITLSLLDSGSNSAYLLFTDRNGNEYYDGSWTCPAGETSECVERVDFSGGNYIESFCILRTSGGDLCNNVSRVDVSFRRPETDANLKFFNNGGSEYAPANIQGAKITLKSPGGLTKTVFVYNSGQVSVQ